MVSNHGSLDWVIMPEKGAADRSQGAALTAREICKTFRLNTGPLPVLDRVSLSIPRGNWVSVVGKSGCGKTTFLKVLAGLIPPDSGEVIVGGAQGRRNIAYMPQSDALFPWRTSLANAIIASEIDGRPLPEAKAEARRLFSRFGLSECEDLYPAELSGGMKKRLALIRTFLAHRDVLLLDEPLAYLDALTRAEIQDWLVSVWQEMGNTVLLVTHDVEEAVYLSDWVCVFSPRPAHVRGEFPVTLPRPRSRTDPSLIELKAQVLGLIGDGR